MISSNFLVWKGSVSAQFRAKLCFSTNFLHQEIRWNYGILRSVKNRPIQLVNFYNSHFNKLSGWLNKNVFFESLTFDKQYLLTFFLDMSSIWNDSSYLICTLQEQREEKCPFEVKTATSKVKTRWNLLLLALFFGFPLRKMTFVPCFLSQNTYSINSSSHKKSKNNKNHHSLSI